MMTREENRRLTEKIEAMNDGSYNPTPEHIEEVLRRTHEELLRREKILNERKAKRRSRLRRVVVVAAVTVGLMAGTLLYGVLAPVSEGKANSILRRASIWINNTLHLGLEVSEPTDDEIGGFTAGMKTEFDTVEEAAKALKTPIAYLGDAGGFSVDKVLVTNNENAESIVSVGYLDENDNSIDLVSMPVYDGNEAMFDADTQKNVETVLGTLYLSETENGLMGVTIYQNYLITIKATIKEEEALPIIQTIKVIN